MLEALKIVVRNGSTILFIVLQLLCFYWVVKFNQKQGQIFFYSLQIASQSLDSKVKDIGTYFSLKEKIKEVNDQNAALLTKLNNYKLLLKKDSLTIPTQDTVNIDQTGPYRIISASVVRNSTARKNNYLTIDKGGKDGVSPGMGVITSNCLAGIVIDTSKNFAIVMSLLHSNSRISAKLKRSGFFGTMVWRDLDPRYVFLDEIQKYADVQVGDTVVTSGHSIIFPEGLAIGEVVLFGVDPGAFTYSIKVKLFESFSSMKEVYLINHELRTEKQSLEKTRIEDE